MLQVNNKINVINVLTNGNKRLQFLKWMLTLFRHEVSEDAFMKIAFLPDREKQIARHIKEGLTPPKIATLCF